MTHYVVYDLNGTPVASFPEYLDALDYAKRYEGWTTKDNQGVVMAVSRWLRTMWIWNDRRVGRDNKGWA